MTSIPRENFNEQVERANSMADGDSGADSAPSRTGGFSEDEGTVVAAPSVTRTALVFQGGGALGAYQVGVFHALDEAGYRPNWFAGTSIGAINAAVMAGNAPEHRLSQLRAFWDKLTAASLCRLPDVFSSGSLFKAWSAWQTALFGQPGFFRGAPSIRGSPRRATPARDELLRP